MSPSRVYAEIFGDDYYIELQDHGLDEQKRTNPQLIQIAKELGTHKMEISRRFATIKNHTNKENYEA